LKRTIYILLFLLIAFLTAFAQPPQSYRDYVARAKDYFISKDYKNSAAFYSMAFTSFGDKGFGEDRYNAAIAYSQLNIADSAFKNLLRLAEKTDFLECKKIEAQQEFGVLKKDKRWQRVKELTCGTNYDLYKIFERIRETDQDYRQQIDGIGKTYGFQSIEMQSNWKKIHYYDSVNLVIIDSLYSIYGWPDPKVAGKKSGTTFWLVIQHSPLFIQEKYLPVIREAVASGKANAGNLAYLEDRILMFKNLPQKYGSQFRVKPDGMKCLYKLQDKKNVNKLREQVGLSPLSPDLIDSQYCD